MDQTCPLEIPEIQRIIGSFLDMGDLLVCARVCRSWHETFKRLIWIHVVLRMPGPQFPSYHEQIRAHAQHIRSLTIPYCPFQDSILDEIGCTLLETLNILPPNDLVGDLSKGSRNGLRRRPFWDSLADLISSNKRSLRHLKLQMSIPIVQRPHPTPSFWEAALGPSPFSLSFVPSTLLERPRLRTLKLCRLVLSLESWACIWNARTFLETLHIESSVIASDDLFFNAHGDSDSAAPDAEETTLQHLTLAHLRGMTALDQLRCIIAPCLALKSLCWQLHPRPHARDREAPLAFGIRPRWVPQWSQLESFYFSGKNESFHNHDSLFSVILDQLPINSCSSSSNNTIDHINNNFNYNNNINNNNRISTLRGIPRKENGEDNSILRKWHTPTSGFGGKAYMSLERHFGSIQDLDLSFCENVTSTMVQEILCSCPVLVHINANTIHIDDIQRATHDSQEPRPWVCTRLRTWCIFIDMAPKPSNSQVNSSSPFFTKTKPSLTTRAQQYQQEQRDVFERLALLKDLESLDLDYNFPRPNRGRTGQQATAGPKTLIWDLEHGLDALKALTKIQTIAFIRNRADAQHIPMASVEWMIQHWPRLYKVDGRLGKQKANESMLLRLLRECDIETG
ncbi:hypothetical protein BGW38_010675 [Lunasporangiospora selenospora]|uniref:F-box domain-containing protein n=1 Tax=Lunasporangiospora selenospora TaxID=979761 RepID=A0A9P6KIC2_9FUNG|nr:hypothetical protein BGW38_010675 [Lunasporangiospora selenospora]